MAAPHDRAGHLRAIGAGVDLAPRAAGARIATGEAAAPAAGAARTGRSGPSSRVQLGILVGAIALWQAAADLGWIDGFFWSKPSAIYATLIIFFTEGDAWTDIGFTFRSTIFGFLLGTSCRLAARPVVLVVAQLCGDRAALRHLLRIAAEARAGAAGHPGLRHRARLEGRDRDGADARRLDA